MARTGPGGWPGRDRGQDGTGTSAGMVPGPRPGWDRDRGRDGTGTATKTGPRPGWDRDRDCGQDGTAARMGPGPRLGRDRGLDGTGTVAGRRLTMSTLEWLAALGLGDGEPLLVDVGVLDMPAKWSSASSGDVARMVAPSAWLSSSRSRSS